MSLAHTLATLYDVMKCHGFDENNDHTPPPPHPHHSFRLIDPERDGARLSTETRPKNMKAVFIIRIE